MDGEAEQGGQRRRAALRGERVDVRGEQRREALEGGGDRLVGTGGGV